MKTKDNFWNVSCFMTNAMCDKIVIGRECHSNKIIQLQLDKIILFISFFIYSKHGLVMTELAFSLMTTAIFDFSIFQIPKLSLFSFSLFIKQRN